MTDMLALRCTLLIFVGGWLYSADADLRRMCGKDGTIPRVYHLNNESCVDGILISITPTTTPHPTTTPPPPPTPPTTRQPVLVPRPEPNHNCSTKLYNKDFATCCQQGYKIKVYDNMPEKDHVCCDLNLYERKDLSSINCVSPALNDGLTKGTPINRNTISKEVCSKSYGFRMNFQNEPQNVSNNKILKASIRDLKTWNGGAATKSMPRKIHIDVHLDEYNAGRHYTSVLIVSNYDYMEGSTGVFYLRSDDVVIRAVKKRGLGKLMKRVKKLCRRRSRNRRHLPKQASFN